MTRDGLRRLLASGVVVALLLPVLLVVVLGLAALLEALGDAGGAITCQRAAIVGGVAWVIAIVVTVAVNGVLTLTDHGMGADSRGRRRGGRRRRRGGQEQPMGLGAGRSPVDGGSGTGAP